MSRVQKPLFSIPVASTSLSDEPVVFFDGGDVILRFTWHSGGKQVTGQIVFDRARAFRNLAEPYCTEWHIKDAYDTVVEVENSDWASELIDAAPEHLKRAFVMNHYLVYLDSFGALEVIAAVAVMSTVK